MHRLTWFSTWTETRKKGLFCVVVREADTLRPMEPTQSIRIKLFLLKINRSLFSSWFRLFSTFLRHRRRTWISKKVKLVSSTFRWKQNQIHGGEPSGRQKEFFGFPRVSASDLSCAVSGFSIFTVSFRFLWAFRWQRESYNCSFISSVDPFSFVARGKKGSESVPFSSFFSF